MGGSILDLVRERRVDQVIFAYSDVQHRYGLTLECFFERPAGVMVVFSWPTQQEIEVPPDVIFPFNALRLVVASALLLAACSSLKLGYNHADTLLLYSLDSYLDLDDRQQELAGERVRRL